MGLISTTALAAHQIALQVTAILFMVPFGIGMAATVRVGHAVGRNDARGGQARRPCRDRCSASSSCPPDARRDPRPVCDRAVFLRRGRRGRAASIELTATLLLVGATFFIADGIQTIAAGSLRGMNDTRIPLLFAAISYWLIGFTAACGLGFRTGWRGRRLDRAVLRDRGLCHASGLAFPRLANRLEFATIPNAN